MTHIPQIQFKVLIQNINLRRPPPVYDFTVTNVLSWDKHNYVDRNYYNENCHYIWYYIFTLITILCNMVASIINIALISCNSIQGIAHKADRYHRYALCNKDPTISLCQDTKRNLHMDTRVSFTTMEIDWTKCSIAL